jgi:hypothetical protein
MEHLPKYKFFLRIYFMRVNISNIWEGYENADGNGEI